MPGKKIGKPLPNQQTLLKERGFPPAFPTSWAIFIIETMNQQPQIPARFREHLEDLQALGRPCAITFRAESGALSTILAKIVSIYNDEGKSYLRTDNGLAIPVERVEEAGGMRARNLA